MKRCFIAVALVVVLLVPVLFMGAFLALASDDLVPSQLAVGEIPADLLPLYRVAASTCDGLPWTVLAAIHKVETGFGRGRVTSSAGAQGPMQFMPPTWRAYGVDGDGDGVADINDVEDAVFGAANLLCANGAGDPARLATAIWNYNHSQAYVADVLALATSYGVIGFGGSFVSAAPGDILNNPRITLTSNARADVAAGLVDPRMLALLDAIALRYPIGISVFKTGHTKYVAGTSSVSNHFYGRAADIFFVAGRPVSSSNHHAEMLVRDLAALSGPARPNEIGHPFAGLSFPGGFSDEAHGGHLHIAYE